VGSGGQRFLAVDSIEQVNNRTFTLPVLFGGKWRHTPVGNGKDNDMLWPFAGKGDGLLKQRAKPRTVRFRGLPSVLVVDADEQRHQIEASRPWIGVNGRGQFIGRPAGTCNDVWCSPMLPALA
jgi:hypothetical protein